MQSRCSADVEQKQCGYRAGAGIMGMLLLTAVGEDCGAKGDRGAEGEREHESAKACYTWRPLHAT